VKPGLRALTAALVVSLAASGCSHAPASRPPQTGPRAAGSPILVEGTWASAAGNQASVYFILSNRGSTADVLTGASSPVATNTVLMRGSRTIRRLRLPADSQISFDGSHQIALTGLRRQLEGGDPIRVTLTFAHSKPVSFIAGVR
jgi:copper(I)-binding protein